MLKESSPSVEKKSSIAVSSKVRHLGPKGCITQFDMSYQHSKLELVQH